MSLFTLYNESRRKHLSCIADKWIVISYQFIYTYLGRLFINVQRGSNSDLKKSLLIIDNILKISCQPNQTFFFFKYFGSVHAFSFQTVKFLETSIFFHYYIYLPKDLMLCGLRILFWNIFCKICQSISLQFWQGISFQC